MNRCLRFTGMLGVAALIMTSTCLRSLSAADQGQYLFQWTDDQGTVHITDDPDKVPAKYRSRTQSIRQSGDASEAGQEQQVQQKPSRDTSSKQGAGAAEASQKAAWQGRVLEAKTRLADAESRVMDLEQRKQVITSQWGAAGAALPPQEVLDEMNQIDSNLARTRREIEDIRNEINVVIPDEARKAGIPPGWLREVE